MTASESGISRLKSLAVEASRNAYCRYSRFAVGAALELDDGQVFVGCNVENASSGLTICAERNAVAQAVVAGGERGLRRLLVYTPTPEPTPPCGACRQVLAEFNPSTEIICVCDGSAVLKTTLGELLPHCFGAHSLES